MSKFVLTIERHPPGIKKFIKEKKDTFQNSKLALRKIIKLKKCKFALKKESPSKTLNLL